MTQKDAFAPNITIKYTQDIVDWINVLFPERNWFFCGGPIRQRVGTADDPSPTQDVGMKKLPIPLLTNDIDKVYTALSNNIDLSSLFWGHYNPYEDRPADEVYELFKLVCMEIMALTEEKNIYLATLHGFLSYEGKDSVKP